MAVVATAVLARFAFTSERMQSYRHMNRNMKNSRIAAAAATVAAAANVEMMMMLVDVGAVSVTHSHYYTVQSLCV